ncbi:hypothetical protein N7492_010739 [Penicillium capsulatum]|uniref:BTB domain-containing protein n=1 Tax=Penicillium capsulatum TaxID=69766 RepID=A0A9W9HKR7_9EURO|nr:hypothetical protein N7492_010739 [Penicillium capsulatum]KAJ6114073.1 hypothetical protein N7512_007518 [Penicillium capsulatum]
MFKMSQSLADQIVPDSEMESLNSRQKSPKIDYNQPVSSCYEHPIITVCIGEKKYGILGSHIRKYPLLGHSSHKTYVTLSDVHEDVAHTLVHFLYSGAYETINSAPDDNISYIQREYQRSVLVYQASRKYHIADLETLAKKYIEYFDEAISPFEILRSIKEIFSRLPEDEVWILGYAKRVLQRSFVSGNSRFNIDDFSGIMTDNDSFSRVIMLAMIEILSSHHRILENGSKSHTHSAQGGPFGFESDGSIVPDECETTDEANKIGKGSTDKHVSTESLVVVKGVSIASDECPVAKEWHFEPGVTDSTVASQFDAKDSLVKNLLPDVGLYHDWETLSSKDRRKRSKKLKARGLPIPDTNGVVSISLM